MHPSRVVTHGFCVKNDTGFCYRGIFIMDYMGSYVPNPSRRALVIFVFLGGSLCLAAAASSFLFDQMFFYFDFSGPCLYLKE